MSTKLLKLFFYGVGENTPDPDGKPGRLTEKGEEAAKDAIRTCKEKNHTFDYVFFDATLAGMYSANIIINDMGSTKIAYSELEAPKEVAALPAGISLQKMEGTDFDTAAHFIRSLLPHFETQLEPIPTGKKVLIVAHPAVVAMLAFRIAKDEDEDLYFLTMPIEAGICSASVTYKKEAAPAS